jgi:hypothetical protein
LAVTIPYHNRLFPSYCQYHRQIRQQKQHFDLHPFQGTHNIDRDAILFHQMQMARASRQSTDSLNSVQSVPANPVMKDFNGGLKTSSHSIEVLIHGQEQKACAHSIGGSEPDTETRHQQNYFGHLA